MTPYISVVVAARNDNHGGDMAGRMQAFLDSWIGQAKRYHLPSEIIVIEWNPPADRGPLQAEFRWPADLSPCSVRFIEVSRELHAAIPNAAAIPLHQMIAKNVGVRRARGQFVLCTNLDIIFSAELMQHLAARSLDARTMYRMDRYDVAKDIPAGAGVDDLLAFCGDHITRVSAREGTFATDGANLRPVEGEDILSPGCGLRLGRGWFGLEHYRDSPVLRYVSPKSEIAFERAPGSERRILVDAEIGPSALEGHIDLDLLDPAGAALASVVVDGRCSIAVTLPESATSGRFGLVIRHGGVAMLQDVRMLDLRVFGVRWADGMPAAASDGSGWNFEVLTREPGVDRTGTCPAPSPWAAQMHNPLYLHTNGCGDFTMLSRDAWLALRGYPEFPVWPTHLDAILCYAAYHAGYAEVMLNDPMRVFHIEHQAVWTPETEREREVRADARGVPLVGFLSLMKQFHMMRRFNVPIIFAPENWGLAGIELPETAR
jgi:hypothetical protein